MANRIRKYKKYIDDIISSHSSDTKWEDIISQHLIQLQFFMHERLIHLIVTVLFAIMAFMVLGLFLMTEFSLPLLILFLLILTLLIPYIQHYYLLENSVQYMYKQYDKLLELSGQSAFKLE